MSANAAIVAEAPSLSGATKAVTAVALALGTFMQVLDTSIANVSIPTISGDLGVSSDQGTWVITSFAVANGVSVPLTGWLMQRYGVVRTFVISVALFTVASLLCGLAWSLPSLIFFRVLQGAVSGPMIPGSQALLINVFGPAKRNTALTVWSLTTLVAPIAGPMLGGYISDNYVWPWIFLINVPVGIICTVICWNNLKSQETPTRKIPIDRVGLVLLFIWVGALQVMLDKGKDLDWFNSALIVSLLLVTVIAFVAWLIWNLTEEHPIVDLSLFKSRSFALGTIALCLGYAVFFGNVVLMPLWLQSYLGYTATWAGFVSAPSGVTAVITSLLVGRLMQRFDPRLIAASSFGFYGLSFFMRAHLTADASFFEFTAPQLVQGFAMGTFFVSMLAVIFDGLPPQKIPIGIGAIELPAHHRRQLRDLPGHDLLGPARSAASDAPRGHRHGVRARLPAITRAAPSVRSRRSGSRGVDDPATHRTELSLVLARSLLSVRVVERGAHTAVLHGPAPRGTRRSRGGRGLNARLPAHRAAARAINAARWAARWRRGRADEA